MPQANYLLCCTHTIQYQSYTLKRNNNIDKISSERASTQIKLNDYYAELFQLLFQLF